MPEFLTFSFKPPFRDLRGRFAKATEEMLKTKRDEIRALGQAGSAALNAAAPVGRRRVLSRSHKFKTFERGTTIELRFYSDAVGQFVRQGTKPHIIRAKRAKALAFHWPKVGMMAFVPRAGFPFTGVAGGAFWIGKGYVNHPGTQPNPYHERAFASLQPTMRDALNRIARAYTETASK